MIYSIVTVVSQPSLSKPRNDAVSIAATHAHNLRELSHFTADMIQLVRYQAEIDL